jgi:hypothetical protein
MFWKKSPAVTAFVAAEIVSPGPCTASSNEAAPAAAGRARATMPDG